MSISPFWRRSKARDRASGPLAAGVSLAAVLPFLALIVVTGAMVLFRERLDKAHVALIYLLVVLGGSVAGRIAGFAIGLLAFLLFNYLFLPPLYTFVVNDPLDWLVLISFLVTSIVAAELLHRQRVQTELAETRRRELDQLSTLGAETLNAARAEHALSAIARLIRTNVNAERCELFVRSGAGQQLADVAGANTRTADRRVADTGKVTASEIAYRGVAEGRGGDNSLARHYDLLPSPRDQVTMADELLAYVAESGRAAIARGDGTVHVVGTANEMPAQLAAGASTFAMPLTARGTTVGVLRISSERGLAISTDQFRVLGALAYYAALGIERLRMEETEEVAEELARVDRLKNSLLAAVSHDLRTPLTTIKALAHEIGLGGSTLAHTIEQEADQLSVLVEGLLELSQLNANAMPMDVQLNTVDELIGAALQRSAALLNDRTVGVTQAHDQLLVGRFDFSHSMRILVNLLENAAKYSAARQPIEISSRRVGSMLELSVADRGPGIAESEHDRIFEPFYRASTASSDVRGAGLGLSIARQFAKAQGGDLRVRTRDGGGSVFTLSIPAADRVT
ncbi:MAG: DUF4118 domain-containing protein [Phycisphaerae bacterium]|nr:DUF4118 domain-containing protein [Gemmatimonadaceae bacterium]